MSPPTTTPLTDEALRATIAAARKWDRLCAAAPNMLALLRRLDTVTPKHPPPGQCGCIVCDARALLARIDGAAKEG